eukprot:13248655-Heterocapsa_arctica.AAC.1
MAPELEPDLFDYDDAEDAVAVPVPRPPQPGAARADALAPREGGAIATARRDAGPRAAIAPRAR